MFGSHVRQRLPGFAAVVLAGWSIRAAPAQAADAPAVVTLEQLVVTATRAESTVLASPVAVSVTTREQIERRPAASVAELLRDVPGVMVADNTLAGMPRLRIRGEDARRSLVLLDGQEISDHTTYGPPLLIDPAFIERIEVVRGPHSTLFGSRAEGGVINIITRRADATRVVAGHATLGYVGASHGLRASAGFAGRAGEFDWRVGVSRTRDGDRRTPDGVLPDSATDSTGLFGKIGWRRGPHELTLSLDRHELTSEASTPDRLLDGVAITAFQLDLPRRDRDKVGLSYDARDLSPVWRQVHADVFWQRIDRRLTQAVAGHLLPLTTPPTLYDYFNDDSDLTDSQGANVAVTIAPLPAHEIVAGFSGLRDRLDKSLARTGTRTRSGAVTPVALDERLDAGIETAALFAHDTWQFAPQWRVMAGARQYFVTSELVRSNDPALSPRRRDDAHLVGSAALVFTPREGLALRAAWSEGYVYPTLLHQHTGSLFAQGNLTRPNPNLRPETSENFELGVRWQRARGELELAVFQSTARDYIESVRASTVPELGWGPNENTYANLNRARTRGAELSASTRFADRGPEFYGQLTYLRRAVTYPTFTTADNGQPRWSGRAGVRHEGRATARGTWYFDAYVVASDEAALRTARSIESIAGWATVNFAAGVQWGEARRWSAGLELLNLGDKSYRPSTDELVQPGRHVNLSVRTEF